MRLSPELRNLFLINRRLFEVDFTESTHESDEDDFYTMVELEQLENKTMAYMAGKFKKLRFRRNLKIQV